MIDPIKNAYLKIKTPAPKQQKKVDTDPILFDGKTFDDEVSARENDPKETIDDVIKHLKETFDTSPSGNVQDHLYDSERTTLSERAFKPENQVYRDTSDHEHIKNMHKTFVDVVKNGVNYDKMNALDKIIDDAPIHMDDKYAIGRMWSRTIRNAFGLDRNQVENIPMEKNSLSKSEMIERAAKNKELKLHSLQHGYTEHEHLNVPIIIKEGTPHVVHSDAMYGGAFDHLVPFHKEAEEAEDTHKAIENVYDEHFSKLAEQEPSKISAIRNYTGAASGRLNRFLIHSHTGNEDALKEEMRSNDHIYPDKESYHRDIDGVSQAIKESPELPHPVVVYSGLSGRSGIIHHAEKHKQTSTEPMTFHLPAFTSTSLKFGTGAAFAKDAPLMPDEHSMYHSKVVRKDIQDVLKIHLPAGHKDGAYVDAISENPGESEYLLDKGQKLKVHPEPSYTLRGRSLYRIWEAHPHKEEE